MRLKSLELYGFKSFADKTTFDFERGVTAFVGPNGCGKSNIVDAVRWILGEQSARAVRGVQMTDVIFNGSPSRRSLGYAEASLTIENDDGRLPVEYSEVCITRRLYRNGESEYFLNRQPCRLRDIKRLFMDTGIGVHTYSIIEQGKVDRFIQANARERRVLLEEAAGISGYKAQRKDAQARLERARQNLEKIDIKLEEQRRQLRSIRAHAARARRYREYLARLRDLDIARSAWRYRSLHDERLRLEGAIASAKARHDEVAQQVFALEAEAASIEAETARLESLLAEKREELHGVENRTQALQTSIRHNEQRIVEYRQETERTTKTIWSLHEKRRQIEDQIAAARREMESLRALIEAQTQTIAAQSREAEVAGQECERIAAAIEEWKSHTLQLIERATTLRNELTHMDRRRREEIARRARLAGQLAEKENESRCIEREIEALAQKRDTLTARLADAGALMREKEEQSDSIEEQRKRLELELSDLRGREARCLSRRDLLQDIESRSEDVESGVKQLLRQSGTNGLRILGMVADLVRADLQYAAAIEAALGDAAQYVVTVNEEDANAAVALLRSDGGRAGLLPVRRASAASAQEVPFANDAGVLGRATEFVRYRPDIEPVVRHLLGNTWVARDLATALRFSANGGAAVTWVTLDGERVEPSGAVVGGEPLPRIGIVSRKSELEAVTRELWNLSSEINRVEGERGRLVALSESLRAEIESLHAEIEKGNLDKLTNENEILNMRRRQKTLDEESALLRSEIAEIDDSLRAYDERQHALEREMDEAGQRRDALHAEIASAQEKLVRQRAVADRLREEVARLHVELAERETRRGGHERELRAAQEALRQIEADIQSARERIEAITTQCSATETEVARAREELDTLSARRLALQEDIRSLLAAAETARQRRSGIAQDVRSLRSRQEDMRRELQEAQLQEQECRLRMEELAERVFNDYSVNLADYAKNPPVLSPAAPSAEDADSGAAPCEATGQASALPGPQATAEPDWDAVQNEINDLREKLRRIGRVDEATIDEEESLELEIAQTEAQREDLVKAEADLREVIKKLNRISREQFLKTFEEVRKNFHETFRQLFGGGRADLILNDDDPDVLETGIEILACPPGKELQSITLLSGGEKTMTTIALVFAIFRAKPSPFCLLDEVDAALDESNIDRFINMLGEFVRESQFIIITHSRRTMSIADVLYGITMEEKGVSKRVAVDLHRLARDN